MPGVGGEEFENLWGMLSEKGPGVSDLKRRNYRGVSTRRSLGGVFTQSRWKGGGGLGQKMDFISVLSVVEAVRGMGGRELRQRVGPFNSQPLERRPTTPQLRVHGWWKSLRKTIISLTGKEKR